MEIGNLSGVDSGSGVPRPFCVGRHRIGLRTRYLRPSYLPAKYGDTKPRPLLIL